jgi:hypothetical protein
MQKWGLGNIAENFGFADKKGEASASPFSMFFKQL